jgi:hypothetical protein
VVLTFIAEVLAGETLVTPGGAVDMATARGLEAFTWDHWLEQLRADEAGDSLPPVEIDALVAATVEALAD